MSKVNKNLPGLTAGMKTVVTNRYTQEYAAKQALKHLVEFEKRHREAGTLTPKLQVYIDKVRANNTEKLITNK